MILKVKRSFFRTESFRCVSMEYNSGYLTYEDLLGGNRYAIL